MSAQFHPLARYVAPILLLLSESTAPGGVILQSEVNPANGHTYHLFGGGPDGRSGIRWTEAEAFSQSLGGHLVTVNDAAENSWISSTFHNYFYVLLGLNDAVQEGQFAWSSGQPATYRNWYSGEPNNFAGNESYVNMYTWLPGAPWSDNPNHTHWSTTSWPFYGLAEVKHALYDPFVKQVFDNSVTWSFHENDTRVTAQFTPNGVTLAEAAALIGVDHFNWLQLVLNASERDLSDPRFSDFQGSQLVAPFVDPVPGGYRYQQELAGVGVGTPVQDDLPFYVDELYDSNLQRNEDNSLIALYTNDTPDTVILDGITNDPIDSIAISPNSLLFYDRPGTPYGDPVVFTTALAGVREDGTYMVLRYEGTAIRWRTEGGLSHSFLNTAPFGDAVSGGQSELLGNVDNKGFTDTELLLIRSTGGIVQPSAVPEPATSVLLSIGGVFVILGRYVRRACA